MKYLKMTMTIAISLAAFFGLLWAIESPADSQHLLIGALGIAAYNVLCLHSLCSRVLTERIPRSNCFRGVSKGETVQ